MPRIDPSFVGQQLEPGVDGSDDLVVVASGQIGATDAAGKEGIAGDQKILLFKVETTGALRVTWGVQNLGRVVPESDGLTVGEARVGLSDLRGIDAQPGGLRIKRGEQRQIVLM